MKFSAVHVAAIATFASVASARPATFTPGGGDASSLAARDTTVTITQTTGSYDKGAERRKHALAMCRGTDRPVFFLDVNKAFIEGWRAVEQGYKKSAEGTKEGNSTTSDPSPADKQPDNSTASSSPPSPPPSSSGTGSAEGTHDKGAATPSSQQPANSTSSSDSSLTESTTTNSTAETPSSKSESKSGTPGGKTKSIDLTVSTGKSKTEIDFVTTKQTSNSPSAAAPSTSHAGGSVTSRDLDVRGEHKWTFWDEIGLAFQTTACMIGHSLGFSPAVQVVAEAGAKIKKT